MKKNQVIYWIATAIISLMMLFSAYQYFTNPELDAAFKHLGFPAYFRIELALAKIVGALVLIIPQVNARIKEWAYAGFGIVFISASIAHFSSGDPVKNIVTPLVLLGILIVSNIYLYKVGKARQLAIS